MAVVIETSLGDITVDLFIKERPKTCFNFLKLCKIKYYNFCLISEIKKHYTVRTGDPSGNGGDSIYIHAHGQLGRLYEAEMEPRIKHTERGCISMINDGNDKHGSQFFITLEKDLDYLDQQGHTVFGVVSEGFETLDTINQQIVDQDGIPYQDICISHTVILEDPYDDPPYLKKLLSNISSPGIPDRLLNSDRIGIYETFNDDEGKSEEQLREEMERKEAKARAIVLEMIGDLPDADIKPPDNVLFVCKLNPITEESDLRVIFSRFGPISSCDIIKDTKTGHSLQYGFIEFENREDCEKAYFKMDNVLIDDRRIHVDFSQSVAKIKWQQYRQMRASKTMNKNQSGHPPVSRHQNLIQNPIYSGRHDQGFPSNRSDSRNRKDKSRRSRSRDRSAKSSSCRSHNNHHDDHYNRTDRHRHQHSYDKKREDNRHHRDSSSRKESDHNDHYHKHHSSSSSSRHKRHHEDYNYRRR